MGWAARAHAGATQRAQSEQDRAALRLRTRLAVLRGRIKAGAELSDADHRMLSLAGPETLAWLGYQPRVTL